MFHSGRVCASNVRTQTPTNGEPMSQPDSYIERRQTVSKEEEARQDQRDLHTSLLVRGAVQEDDVCVPALRRLWPRRS